MENLPYLVLKKIFDESKNLNELIKCSLICRNWRRFYESFYKPNLLCLCMIDLMPIKKRLDYNYSNERIGQFNVFKMRRLEFLNSQITRQHFGKIKKLIFFGEEVDISMYKSLIPKFSFEKQLNYFKNLEYLDLSKRTLVLVDGVSNLQINLPKLRYLDLSNTRLGIERNKFFKKWQIKLNTPQLEVFKLHQNKMSKDEFLDYGIENYEFVNPKRLKHLTFTVHKKNFRLGTRFQALFSLQIYFDSKLRDENAKNSDVNEWFLLSEDFLIDFPNLRFLFVPKYDFDINDLSDLSRQEREFNLSDLNIIEVSSKFDYANCSECLSFKGKINSWPSEFNFDFNKLIKYRILIDYIKENYLRINCLIIDNVTNEKFLEKFLKKIGYLAAMRIIGNNCNLTQNFFDHLPNYLTIGSLKADSELFYNLIDLNFLSRLKFKNLNLIFNKLSRDVLLNLFKNEYCLTFKFNQNSNPENHIYDFEDDDDEDEKQISNLSRDQRSKLQHQIYKKRQFILDDEFSSSPIQPQMYNKQRSLKDERAPVQTMQFFCDTCSIDFRKFQIFSSSLELRLGILSEDVIRHLEIQMGIKFIHYDRRHSYYRLYPNI